MYINYTFSLPVFRPLQSSRRVLCQVDLVHRICFYYYAIVNVSELKTI